LLLQSGVDGGQDLRAQVMGMDQVAKAHPSSTSPSDDFGQKSCHDKTLGSFSSWAL
jgi:hypothetical protein